MSRRTLAPQVLSVTLNNVVSGSGIQTLVAPAADVILQPKSAVISSHSGGAFEYNVLSGSTVILHGHVPSNGSMDVSWPDGFEQIKGSGLFIEPLTNDGSISLYYCAISEAGGITKEAARAATYSAYKNAATKATRTPNRFGAQTEG
jgi:hypothetical protein